MISRITNISQFPQNLLSCDIYGRRIAAYLAAYGTEYPFCAAYLYSGENTAAAILRFNNAVTITGSVENADELADFISMFRLDIIEGPTELIKALPTLPETKVTGRILFRLRPTGSGDFSALDCTPSLDRVYEILSEAFPELADFGMWLTDTSHRCRHGISRVFMYKNLSVASILFEDENMALVGEIATAANGRGQGSARQMLYLIADMLERAGKRGYLFAFPHRASFYRELGFEAEAEHMVILRDEDLSNRDISIFDEYAT